MTRESAPGSIDAGIASLLRSREAAVAAAPPALSRAVPIDDILPSPYQPPGRRSPTDAEVLELADDMLVRGQLVAILLRPKAAQWELMGGERRWRAVHLNRTRVAPDQRARWETIRAEIRDASDIEAADCVAAENLQREQLTALDEAYTYAALMDLHQFTQAKQLAEHLKRPLRTIQRLLQLNRAPEFLKEALAKGVLLGGGEGEGGQRTHRKLEKEQALAFFRLYEFLAKQMDPKLQREADVAGAAISTARAAVAEAPDDASKEAARKRLERAQASAERAVRRVQRAAEARAQARVSGAIQRALTEEWSLRRVETLCHALAEQHCSPDGSAPSAETPAAEASPLRLSLSMTLERPLYEETRRRLVVHCNRIATADDNEKAELLGVLQRLSETLQRGGEAPPQTGVSADAP